jgi:phosphopantothenoylcysteine synthetase/decarboxylase
LVVSRPLALVVCGAPLASRTPDIAAALIDDDWIVSVISTPSADAWLDLGAVEAVTGVQVRTGFRQPTDAKPGAEPEVLVVCPATFNTVNKAAIGASDSYAVGILCEFLGTRQPTLIVPMVNNKLWGHPVWQTSLDVLRGAGTVFLDVRTGERETNPVESGTGQNVVASFDPRWVAREVKTLAP